MSRPRARELQGIVPGYKTELFVSTEQTATGSAQSIAHTLGYTPSRVMVIVTAGHDGAGGAGTQFPTVSEGTHDASNLSVTVTAGAKFKVAAI